MITKLPVEPIDVQERGSKTISKEKWQLLQQSPDFWKLVDQDILAVSQKSNGSVILKPSCFVGSAICGDLRVNITEKIPGALEALLGLSSRDSRIELIHGPSTVLSSTISRLAEEFLQRVEEYVRTGRGFFYDSVAQKSSLVAGRLRVIDTVRLRTRGIRHIVAFDRPTINRRTDLNRLVHAALQELEVIHQLGFLTDSLRIRARAMAFLFRDCADPRRPVLDWNSLLQKPFLSADVEQEDLAKFASAVLARQGTDPFSAQVGTSPLTWFVNMETLFEDEVRKAIATVFSGNYVVTKESSRYVYKKIRRYKANPDILIGSQKKFVAVGDVKYKTFERRPKPSDIYQLLAHTSTYSSSLSFLVYPSDSFQAVDFRRSRSGIRTWVFAFDIKDLLGSAAQMAACMSI